MVKLLGGDRLFHDHTRQADLKNISSCAVFFVGEHTWTVEFGYVPTCTAVHGQLEVGDDVSRRIHV